MNKFQFFRRLTALVMVSSVLMTSALAVEYDISVGNVTVKGGEDGSVSSWQEGGSTGYTADNPSSDKNISITGSSYSTDSDTGKKTVEHTVTLDNAAIDNSDTGNAGLTISADSDVVIEVNGKNALTGGNEKAGLNVGEGASVTIKDDDEDGSLIATGTNGGAGIGGNSQQNAGSITIEGGTITANGSVNSSSPSNSSAAGIGGGGSGSATEINITGGDVTATGGKDASGYTSGGAGIGGGTLGGGGMITIAGDATVTAIGSSGGAGIGSGYQDNEFTAKENGTTTITIGDTSNVTAQGNGGGAGIGGGMKSDDINITISGDTFINASSLSSLAPGGAGIGSGNNSDASTSSSSTKITIDGNAKVSATGGSSSAGIGGGQGYDGGDITISTTGEVVATGGDREDPQSDADKTLGGAGIGGGAGGGAGTITIENAINVTATGAGGGAGIGSGGNDSPLVLSPSEKDFITIKDAVVTANGGEGAAGIGAGKYNHIQDITIDSSMVTATGGESGAGIGSGAGITLGCGSTAKNISILGSAIVHAIGGNSAAAIGSGANGSTVDAITIGGEASVSATGGNLAAGIGSGNNLSTAANISIGGDATVEAFGGTNAAAIGAGNWSSFGKIVLESGKILALSGQSASGIGSGSIPFGSGSITIADGVNLMAYGDQYFAIDLRANNDFAKTILNGRFANATLAANTTYQIVSVDENGKEQVISPMTMTTDETGKLTIGTTNNLEMLKNGNLFESFAISGLEAGKTYYIRPVGSKEFTTYSTVVTDENGKQLSKSKGADRQLGYQTGNADQITFSVYDVTYAFQAAEGTTQQLPASVLALLPSTSPGNKVTEVNPQATLNTSFDKVSVPGGTWSFDGWTTAAVVTNNTVADTVNLIGTWTFTPSSGGSGGSSKPDPTPEPDPEPEPEPNPEPGIDIPEEDPPLADIPEEDPPLTDIPEEDPPLADIPEEEPPLAEAPHKQPSPKPAITESSLVEISDEAVPLADVPKTGDLSLSWYSALLLSACGLTALVLLKKRERDA